jgi:hypothetical protein
LGLTLELSVVDKNGVRIELPNFLRWDAEAAADDAEAIAVDHTATTTKVVARSAGHQKTRG